MLRSLLAACLFSFPLFAQGLTFREVQERARQNDPRVKQAAAQLLNAHGKRDEAVAQMFPTIDYTGYVAGPTPEHRLVGGDNDPNPADPTHRTPGSMTTWGGELGVQAHGDVQVLQPLFTFGKISAGKRAATGLVEANEALLRRAQDQAAFDAARAFWGWQTARNADDSVQKIRQRLDDAKSTADRLIKEESEQITKADRLKLDYLSEEIEAMHASALKNRDLAVTGMRVLLGLAVGDAVPVAQQDLPQAPNAPALDQLLQRAFSSRPEVRAAEAGIRARQALVELETARLFPDIGLVFGWRFTETTNASNPPSPFLSNPYHENWGYAALGLRGNFDIMQKLARRRQAEADLAETLALRQGAEQLVRLDVQTALGDLNEARAKADRYTRETAIGKQLATQAAVAFDTGLGEARELLEDTLLFARADGERLKALYDAQIAFAALEKAVGAQLAP